MSDQSVTHSDQVWSDLSEMLGKQKNAYSINEPGHTRAHIGGHEIDVQAVTRLGDWITITGFIVGQPKEGGRSSIAVVQHASQVSLTVLPPNSLLL